MYAAERTVNNRLILETNSDAGLETVTLRMIVGVHRVAKKYGVSETLRILGIV